MNSGGGPDPLDPPLIYATAGEAVKALTDEYCTIVFVISLRFVHNYLFEIHFFQRHRKNRMINKCAEDVGMSTVVCEK
jgi:hypothetical protein